jgi:hypothetical protein
MASESQQQKHTSISASGASVEAAAAAATTASIVGLTAQVLWTVMTVHFKTSFVVLWFLANFLSIHGV